MFYKKLFKTNNRKSTFNTTCKLIPFSGKRRGWRQLIDAIGVYISCAFGRKFFKRDRIHAIY